MFFPSISKPQCHAPNAHKVDPQFPYSKISQGRGRVALLSQRNPKCVFCSIPLVTNCMISWISGDLSPISDHRMGCIWTFSMAILSDWSLDLTVSLSFTIHLQIAMVPMASSELGLLSVLTGKLWLLISYIVCLTYQTCRFSYWRTLQSASHSSIPISICVANLPPEFKYCHPPLSVQLYN